MLSAMKHSTLSAQREVHIRRSAKRDDHQVARPRCAHSCERSELRAKRATRMCERSEQIFSFNGVGHGNYCVKSHLFRTTILLEEIRNYIFAGQKGSVNQEIYHTNQIDLSNSETSVDYIDKLFKTNFSLKKRSSTAARIRSLVVQSSLPAIERPGFESQRRQRIFFSEKNLFFYVK